MTLRRRTLLASAAAVPLAACHRRREPSFDGGWVGAQHERGHRLRELKSGSLLMPAVQRRVGVLIVGAGVAGLACARALSRAHLDDVHLLDLEDAPGGNSRGHQMAGMACPLGAHYLPVPGDAAIEVVELLEELGLSRVVHGQRVYDERHLCHSPQERLFIHGHWQEGLLPVLGQGDDTLAQYRRFSREVTQAEALGFSIPTARSPWTAQHQALDAVSFTQWLADHGFTAGPLLHYLDYCCRDDYGAGAAQVSAWAGLHYFASRHGFRAPGMDDAPDRDAVLTWPQGNAWLTERLAAPLRERMHTGRVALRVEEGRHEVAVDVWDARAQRSERWVARHVVMATPLFIAARLLTSPPAALQTVAPQMRYAPWLVANLQLDEVLDDLAGGAPPSWDNVIESSPSLGYVDAMHQSTRPYPGPTVLTSYWALGGDTPAQLQAERARLLSDDWARWARVVLDDLALAHPDLPAKVKRIDLMRYGHAMSIPHPGVRGSAALQALPGVRGRVRFAHSDLSAYSVFEEAFFHGHQAALGLTTSRP
ncbi:MAG: FAD-dependent oxidoreductase [Rhizobacter sp.]|nr:FAD-dependent oxidoreductase [Rhizobacter sp.]